MKKVIIAALATCCISVPAYAQDDAGLGGFKVGVVAGYDSTKVTIKDEGESDSGSKGGFLYGLTAGYDYSLGKMLVGIETEISDSTMKVKDDDDDESTKASISASRDLYVGARFGVAVSPSVLLYAKAGYTNTRLKSRFEDDTDTYKGKLKLDGYRLGAGAELVKGRTFGRIEYRYSDYGKITDNDPDFEASTSVSRHQVAVTGGIRF